MRSDKKTAQEILWRVIEERAPAPGDRLPPERVLKDFVGCSRETLRAALAALEAEGEIWRHVGQGTFRGRAPIGRPMKDTLLLEATTPSDLMDARRLLEPQDATAAAMRRIQDDIVLLRRRVAEGRAARDRAACERADDAFHQTIAQVARNPLLIALLRPLPRGLAKGMGPHLPQGRCEGIHRGSLRSPRTSRGRDRKGRRSCRTSCHGLPP